MVLSAKNVKHGWQEGTVKRYWSTTAVVGGGEGGYWCLSSMMDSLEGFWHKQIGGGQNQPKNQGNQQLQNFEDNYMQSGINKV